MPSRKFLAPRAAAGSDGLGYRSTPLRPLPIVADQTETVERIRSATNIADEPEAISDDIVDGYAEVAAFHHSLRHAAEVQTMREQVRPLLRAEDRLRDAERRAKQAKRRDLKGEFMALRGMLARYRQDEPKPESSVVQRLERVEAALDGLEKAA
jgi:hypothetical protein